MLKCNNTEPTFAEYGPSLPVLKASNLGHFEVQLLCSNGVADFWGKKIKRRRSWWFHQGNEGKKQWTTKTLSCPFFSIWTFSTKLCFQCSHCRRRALLRATTTLRAEQQKASLPASSPQYRDFTVCLQWVLYCPIHVVTIKWLHIVLLMRLSFISVFAACLDCFTFS